MLDDLTNQLVKALDTSDVVGSSEAESPFGKIIFLFFNKYDIIKYYLFNKQVGIIYKDS